MTLKRKSSSRGSTLNSKANKKRKSISQVTWTVLDFIYQNEYEVKVKWGSCDIHGKSTSDSYPVEEWIPRSNVTQPKLNLKGVPYLLRENDENEQREGDVELSVENEYGVRAHQSDATGVVGEVVDTTKKNIDDCADTEDIDPRDSQDYLQLSPSPPLPASKSDQKPTEDSTQASARGDASADRRQRRMSPRNTDKNFPCLANSSSRSTGKDHLASSIDSSQSNPVRHRPRQATYRARHVIESSPSSSQSTRKPDFPNPCLTAYSSAFPFLITASPSDLQHVQSSRHVSHELDQQSSMADTNVAHVDPNMLSSDCQYESQTSTPDHDGSATENFVLSPFRPSQVIQSTDPQTADQPPLELSPHFTDTAAAANLSQLHSGYHESLGDRSAFGMIVGDDIVINTSSSVHTLLSLSAPAHGSTVPETQSQQLEPTLNLWDDQSPLWVSPTTLVGPAQLKLSLSPESASRRSSMSDPESIPASSQTSCEPQVDLLSSWDQLQEEDMVTSDSPGSTPFATQAFPDADQAVFSPQAPEVLETLVRETYDAFTESFLPHESLPSAPSQMVDTLASAPPRPVTQSSGSNQDQAAADAYEGPIPEQTTRSSDSPSEIDSAGAPDLTEAQQAGASYTPADTRVERRGSFLDRLAFDFDMAKNERVVPVYFDCKIDRKLQQDSYLHLINHSKSRTLADKFADTNNQDDQTCIKEVDELLAELHQVTQHGTLMELDDASQQPQSAAELVAWDTMFSAKLNFVRRLLNDNAHSLGFYAALVVNDKRLYSAVEQFLVAARLPIWRDLTIEPIVTSVLLLAGDEQPPVGINVDIVVLMDGYHGDKYETIRKRKDGSWGYLTTLVVPFTPEHLLRCLDTGSQNARRAQLLDGVVRLKRLAGEHAEIDANTKAADEIQDLIKRSVYNASRWKIADLPSVEPLSEFIEQYERTRSGQTQLPASQVATQSPSTVESAKRKSVDALEGQTGQSKKQRLAEVDATHVSDSVGQLSQPGVPVPTASSSSVLPFVSSSISQTGLPSMTSIPRAEVEDLLRKAEAEILAHAAKITELTQIMDDREQQMQDLRNRFVDLTSERNELKSTVERALQAKQTQSEREQGLRDTRDELRQQLAAAHESLANHDVPERRELEESKAENRQQQAQIAALEKKLADAKSREAYIFEQYQRMSHERPEMEATIEELEEQVAVLTKKASDERVKALTISGQMQTDKLQGHIARYRQQVKSLSETIAKQDDDIRRYRMLESARVSTRASKAREQSEPPTMR